MEFCNNWENAPYVLSTRMPVSWRWEAGHRHKTWNSSSATCTARASIRDSVNIRLIAAGLPGAALMFKDFAAMVDDAEWRERSMQVSENTQLLLDAAWQGALRNATAG